MHLKKQKKQTWATIRNCTDINVDDAKKSCNTWLGRLGIGFETLSVCIRICTVYVYVIHVYVLLEQFV